MFISLKIHQRTFIGLVRLLTIFPSEKEAFMLYIIGPNYAGGLELDMSIFQVYDVITEKTLRSIPEVVPVMVDPSSINLNYLHEKIMFVLCIRNMVVGTLQLYQNFF